MRKRGRGTLSGSIAAGLSAGIGSVIGEGGSTLVNAAGTTPLGQALMGAGSYASQAAAAHITGQPSAFSWAGVIATAVASGLTAEVGLKGEPLQRLGQSAGSLTQNIAGGLLSGALTKETSQLLGDHRTSNWSQVGEDAFGNALGNAIVQQSINSYQRMAQLNASVNQQLTSEQQQLSAQMDNSMGAIAINHADDTLDRQVAALGAAQVGSDNASRWGTTPTSVVAYGASAPNTQDNIITGAPNAVTLGGVVAVTPDALLTTSQRYDIYRAVNDPINAGQDWNVNVAADGHVYMSGSYYNGAVDVGGFTITPSGDAEWATSPASVTFVTPDRRSGAQREAQADAEYQRWWHDESFRAASFLGKLTLTGVTAGFAGAFMGPILASETLVVGATVTRTAATAARMSTGLRVLSAGAIWGTVGAITSMETQGVDMLAYQATDGAVGRGSFSWSDVGSNALLGLGLGLAGEFAAPYIAKGASWLVDQLSGGEQVATTSRFTAEQLEGIGVWNTAVKIESAFGAGLDDELVVATNSSATGAFNSTEQVAGGDGLGIFSNRQVVVTTKGFGLVSDHLSQFDEFPPNQMMLRRLQTAMGSGAPVTGADAVFYTHEASEATMMARGMSYEDAHALSLKKYGVSPYSVYHSDVVRSNPEWLNQNWRNFWKIDQ